MKVDVIEIYPDHYVIEYDDADGYIQRRVIAQGLHKIVTKGPATLSDDIVGMAMEYSNVNLASVLGDTLPPIRVQDLEDALRRAGLWVQKDYETKAGVVSGVWQRLRGVDVTTILNAALRRLG